MTQESILAVTPLPCPFCAVALDTNRLGSNPRHPDNDCYLSGYVIHVSQLTAWNTRLSSTPTEADRNAVLEEAAPNLCAAFRTTVASGGNYTMTFRFQTLEAMQAADREWHALRALASTPPTAPADIALLEAAVGLRDDLLNRAKWDGEVRVVCAGAGAWVRFNDALEAALTRWQEGKAALASASPTAAADMPGLAGELVERIRRYEHEDIERTTLTDDLLAIGEFVVVNKAAILSALSRTPAVTDEAVERASYQRRVGEWAETCFPPKVVYDRLERRDRFVEEALELAQTLPDFTADRAHALVDYVFSRPVGVTEQEVGGAAVTLAALCHAEGIDQQHWAEVELTRISAPEVIEKIRAKQAAKPVGSALPMATLSHPVPGDQAPQSGAAIVDGPRGPELGEELAKDGPAQ
jgi:hypothetical protein